MGVLRACDYIASVAYHRQLTQFKDTCLPLNFTRQCIVAAWPDLIPSPPPCHAMSVTMGRNQTHNVREGEGRNGMEGGEKREGKGSLSGWAAAAELRVRVRQGQGGGLAGCVP